jgi:hypothetical protein
MTGQPGTESDWQEFCEFELHSGKLFLGDSLAAPELECGTVYPMPPGRYRVEARVMTYGDDQRVSRLRAWLADRTPSLGEEVGEAWCDVAQIGFCDNERWPPAYNADPDAAWEKVEDQFFGVNLCAVVVLDEATDAVMVTAQSGFGDGTYPVYELADGGERVGFEVEFIKADEPYPF